MFKIKSADTNTHLPEQLLLSADAKNFDPNSIVETTEGNLTEPHGNNPVVTIIKLQIPNEQTPFEIIGFCRETQVKTEGLSLSFVCFTPVALRLAQIKCSPTPITLLNLTTKIQDETSWENVEKLIVNSIKIAEITAVTSFVTIEFVRALFGTI